MATFRKRSGAWYVEVVRTINGERVRRSATFDSKSAAQIWASQIETELADPALHMNAEGVTFKDASLRYLREVTPTKRGADTERKRMAKILRLCQFANDPIHKITAEQIGQYRDRRIKEVSGSSVNRELTTISGVFVACRREWGLCHSNPVSDIRKPKENPGRTRRVADSEVELLVAASGYCAGSVATTKKQLAILHFMIAIETGMRSGEICSITEDSFFDEQNYVHLSLTKNGTARDVPLSPKAKELIQLKLKVPPITPVQVDVHFRKVRDKTELEDLRFHDSRHEACSRLSKIFDVMELAKIVGHTNPKQTMAYYHPTPSDLASKFSQ